MTTKEHRLWIRIQRAKFPNGRSSNEDAYCANCHCAGNRECGHEPLNEHCSLDMFEECPCCDMAHEPMGDKEYDELMGQETLPI